MPTNTPATPQPGEGPKPPPAAEDIIVAVDVEDGSLWVPLEDYQRLLKDVELLGGALRKDIE